MKQNDASEEELEDHECLKIFKKYVAKKNYELIGNNL